MGKLATMKLRAREGIRISPLIGIHTQVIRNTRDHSCSLMGISDLKKLVVRKGKLANLVKRTRESVKISQGGISDLWRAHICY